MTRPRLNMEISLGNILLILGMGISATIFTVRSDSEGKGTARELGLLRGDVDRLRSTVEEIRLVVNPIGSLNTRVTETERRLTEQDARDNAQDQRLGVMAEAIATLRARVEYVAQPGRRTVP